MSHFWNRSRRLTALSLTLIGTLALSACGGSAKPEPQQPEVSPQEQLEQEAGVSIEPGLASCEFNNELAEDGWDGSGEHPFGDLDTAELRETNDAYEVTLTGDFLAPNLVTDDSRLQTQVSLVTEDDGVVSLYSEYMYDELSQTGTVVDGEVDEFDTKAELEQGKFTASFPKSSADLDGFTPEMWFASVTYDDGEDAHEPVSFRCGDGRNWNWEPLD